MTPKNHKLDAHLWLALAVLAAAPAALAVAPARAPAIYREGEVLVRYRAGAEGPAAQAVKAKLGLVAGRRLLAGRVELLKLPSPLTTANALAVLRADPAIERVEPNFLRYPRTFVPNDVYFGQQWGLRNTGQSGGTAGADLNMVNAWDADGNGAADRVGNASVIVAVIDDAIQWNHPDFTPNIVARHNFIDCQDPDDPSPVSANGAHGTLTSGCIAAVGGNAAGVAGIAWGASLMPLKFGFDSATHIEALNWARDHGAKIVNASFGGPGFSQEEEDLIAALAADDILYVTSAGNADSNTDVAQLNYPAHYDADNIVAVAATNRADAIASFSQYGPLTVDVAAPGQQIVTTAINDGYGSVSGTSFSAPYVSGVAALLKSHVAPTPDWSEVKARLVESGSAVGAANPKQKTVGGRVDADRALDMADRPSLVIRSLAFDDPAGNGNDLPDPGESLNASFTVRNQWQDASDVSATLVADNGVGVTSGAQPLGTILADGEAVATFAITVPNVTEHRYVNFTLTLTADSGAYTATRSAGFEIGALAAGGGVTQSFSSDAYDEFHAWHLTIPAQTGKTLFIRTGTAGGEDIDLLVKRSLPPRYNITVGINPETQAGFFCTSGTTLDCQDPQTLVSGRLDGAESVSVVDPPAGTYHIVVVNFDQQALPYTLEAELLDGDLRPDPFQFTPAQNVPNNTLAYSNTVTIGGISAPTAISVAGGEYRIGSGAYTTTPGTVAQGQTVRVRTSSGSGFGYANLTVGGFTATFLVNPGAEPDFDSGDTGCGGDGGGDGCAGLHCGDGGVLPLSLLVLLLLGALARRRHAA